MNPKNLYILLSAAYFLGSLLLVILTSNWFTRRLENICDLLGLPTSVLSLLGALGANIPNYAASIVAIAGGHTDTGLGIIIGSNIYNVAIILAISTFATPERILLKGVRDVRRIGGYSLIIMSAVLIALWLLPGAHGLPIISTPALLIAFAVLILGIFGALVIYVLRRPHTAHSQPVAPSEKPVSLPRSIGEAVAALLVALGGVVTMVQSGQDLTIRLHMPQALAGLLVLAVATSLPNTVVAIILARTGRAAACVEEIFSSNSINASLGIAVPLLIWREMVTDRLLLLLDAPLMVMLTVAALLCVLTGRLSRLAGGLLLLVYVSWVIAHILL